MLEVALEAAWPATAVGASSDDDVRIRNPLEIAHGDRHVLFVPLGAFVVAHRILTLGIFHLRHFRRIGFLQEKGILEE
jgi:hypothetical protein